MTRRVIACTLVAAGFAAVLVGQTPERVDFARDIQPILQKRCVGCHGSEQHMNGYRLDRKSAAFGGMLRSNIIPGSSESSRVYRRIIGSQFGLQMPPTGPLPQAEVDLLKHWIDEGANWPTELANEAQQAPPDPQATKLNETIRHGMVSEALRQFANSPDVLRRTGPGGTTPLMEAALLGDAQLVSEMLRRKADVNAHNHAGATALMWSVEHLEIVRMLLDAGADPNARSTFGRTALAIASGQPRSEPVVKLLLDRGAKTETKPRPATQGLVPLLPPIGSGDLQDVRQALEAGADLEHRDAKRRTPLIRAAILDEESADVVRMLLEHGAKVTDKTPEGLTALDFAKRSGNPATIKMLREAGATESEDSPAPHDFVENNTVRAAIRRSLPLLQRAGATFHAKSGCVSCHHNSLTQVTVAAARLRRFEIDEMAARRDVEATVHDVMAARDQALQGLVIPGGFVTTTGYLLIGLDAERHEPDAGTDALVRLMRTTQLPGGNWRSAYRPPSESSEFTATAVCLRALQLYGSKKPGSADGQARKSAAAWLATAKPHSTEDVAYRLMGLTWAGAEPAMKELMIQDLTRRQRDDGGWPQTVFLQSDAYATGLALVALAEAGVRPDAPAHQKGMQFLLRNQLKDGSWFVRSRSHVTQIYFESGFPHGANQFISAAATNWATQALLRAAGPTTRVIR